MKTLWTTLLLAVGLSVYAEVMIDLSGMARTLENSVVKLTAGRGHCTAAKIGDREYLTAGHCATSEPGAKIESTGDRILGYFFQDYVTRATKKKDSRRVEDWAIIHTSSDSDDIPSLEIGCGEVLYPGQPVAYYGYSGDSGGTFGTGRIVSLRELSGRNHADFGIDVSAAPGSSGSPIISLDSGRVIGVLTEGVRDDRAGYYMIGVESIEHIPQCQDYEPGFPT